VDVQVPKLGQELGSRRLGRRQVAMMTSAMRVTRIASAAAAAVTIAPPSSSTDRWT